MKILKKNQIVIWVVALMLIAAGYLNYSTTDNNQDISTSNPVENTVTTNQNLAGLGDATLVNGDLVSNDELTQDTQISQVSTIPEEENNEDTSVQTNSSEEKNTQTNNNSDEYYTSSRLERETMYSQMLESYQKMVNSQTITSEQKAIAQNEINKINTTKNAIMITENLIKTKGFADCVVFVNGQSVNAVIKGENLSTQQVAQIQNIISRELSTAIEDIHITTK